MTSTLRLAALGLLTLAAVPATAQSRIAVIDRQRVLEEIDERRDVRAVMSGAGLAGAATLLWILLLRGIFALDRRVGLWAARKVGERVQKVKVSARPIGSSSRRTRSARRSIVSSVTPASFGVHGPGESTMWEGASASILSTSSSSLRNTFTSAPSSPKYCTRLKVNES